jgi:hypothetical protein
VLIDWRQLQKEFGALQNCCVLMLHGNRWRTLNHAMQTFGIS